MRQSVYKYNPVSFTLLEDRKNSKHTKTPSTSREAVNLESLRTLKFPQYTF